VILVYSWCFRGWWWLYLWTSSISSLLESCTVMGMAVIPR